MAVGGEGLRYVGAFLITFGAAWALTPLAGGFAHRHGFLDQPGGHSTHSTATPTLGGLAVAGAFDDRRSVSPWLRLGLEAAAAVALWVVGVRAGLLGHTWFDLPLTVLWVMAVVNAFNMIDNHDGIAALVAAFSLAVAGACLGFFVHNKPPATIFLGDAGSMFLGFLVAALALKVDLP